MPGPLAGWRAWGPVGASAITAVMLLFATALVELLEGPVGVPTASATYLLAVIGSAALFGTPAGIGASVAAFLLYDFLFVEPRYTFTVADPGEWLNLILLLVVGIAVGQLAAALRSRAETAIAREREARALFGVSRALATRVSTMRVLDAVADVLLREAHLDRVWIGMARGGAAERVVADTGSGVAPRTPPASYYTLRRMPGETPAEWVRVHTPTVTRAASPASVPYRVILEANAQTLGSIWAMTREGGGPPAAAETRLLAAAADQLGQAFEQDRLAEEARNAEVALRSDELKSALLESVSHDLRTPLATIRAAAGTIMDRHLDPSREDVVASAEAIDREADHLNRVVTNLLDLSRIEGGALRPEIEPTELSDVVQPVLERLRAHLAKRVVDVELPDTLPLVLVDPVYLDQIIANLVENACKYVPEGQEIRIRAIPLTELVRLTVEDSGPGVPDESLSHLFEKFYRVSGSRRSRPGTGIGLTVVRGLTEAMGGRVTARPSELGGLAVDVDMQRAADEDETAHEADAAIGGAR
ncbi:MAG TPA: ATP-binding protein [Candidatus Limnocylindria bacterium]